MNLLLDLSQMNYAEKISDFGDKIAFGGMMLGIGMLAVFAVLCSLWGALIIFKICFYDLPSKKISEPAPKEDIQKTIVPIEAPVSGDEEIIAVLAAAIAMAESESSGVKFRVVSFNRK